ncbi:MAG: riboflavin synthase [Alphaproteobacteria bacterium]
MFTGIVQGLGKITKINKSSNEVIFDICPLFKINDYTKGESIAVNGACLTVEKFDDSSFSVYASQETLNKTNLKELAIDSIVNLERALSLKDRLGGHLVTGHIDGTIKLKHILKANSSIKLVFEMPEEFYPFIVSKGSVCLDGISLTVNECLGDSFDVNIIPETQNETTIKHWSVGDAINLETDILGKYVYKNLGFNKDKVKSNISFEFLAENGYM